MVTLTVRRGISTPLSLVLFLAAGFAHAADAGRKTELRYERREGRNHAATRRHPAPLPEALRLEHAAPQAADNAGTAAHPGASSTRPGKAAGKPGSEPARTHDERSEERAAREAARWAAGKLAAGAGRREYYRVGFYSGLRETRHLPGLGNRDYLQGKRHAWRDPQARNDGSDLGRSAAEDLAREEARERVVGQFMDLTVEPRFLPVPIVPLFEPAQPIVPEPTLAQTMADFPLAADTVIGPRHATYLAGWSYGPSSLLLCESHDEFYAATWADASRAFDYWRADPGRSATYRRLSMRQQLAFRTLFEQEFQVRLGRLFHSHLEAAYELGFADGWSYGTFVHHELAYRLGYRDGFLEAHADAATSEFESSYPGRYFLSYGLAFADWSGYPHPVIETVRLLDGDDDGVFEPGERLLVDYDVVNYGGSGGLVAAYIDGSSLEAPGRIDVELPARGRVSEPAGLEARIAGAAATGPAELGFTIGDQSRAVSLRISYPLQFRRASLHTRRDNLSGDVWLDLQVENQSRRPRAGRIELSSPSLPGFRESRELEVVAAGGFVPLSFEVRRIDPLDLIAGRVSFDFSVISDGVMHHHVAHRLPDTVRDLSSRDLPQLIVRQSHDRLAKDTDIAAARDLLLLRLREDWKVAARGRGNPYKQDFKGKGRRTALGDLVAIYRQESRTMARPDVFAGLSGAVLELAEVLPGVHPRLRKYMRRLATELP